MTSVLPADTRPVGACPQSFMPATPRAEPWFAVRVRSKCEKISSIALHDRGYEDFAPTYRSRRFWSDRVKELDLPLFPGYIFCRFDPHNRLPILTVPGVVSIVGIGKIPVEVEEQEIVRIRTIIRSGRFATPWPFLCTGQRVSIKRGPLAGVVGILVNLKSQQRLVVSITILQRSVSVEVDGDCIEAVS